MIQEPIRWLIDQDLPQVSEEAPDTMNLSECGRDVLQEALKEDRAVVTANEYLLDSKTIPFNCPPIVIVNGGFLTPEALLRNLRHFEFCLFHDEGLTSLTGQRLTTPSTDGNPMERYRKWRRGRAQALRSH